MKPVLVIEDNEDLRMLYERALRNEGYPTHLAENGQIALQHLEQSRAAGLALPRAIILDLMMPVMDGWTFLIEREKDLDFKKIPLLICSAAKDAPPEGFRFLRKPIQLDELLDFIEASSD